MTYNRLFHKSITAKVWPLTQKTTTSTLVTKTHIMESTYT